MRARSKGQPFPEPDGHEEARPVLAGEALDGRRIQVVVVIVRDHRRVDAQQVLEAQAAWNCKPGPLGQASRAR